MERFGSKILTDAYLGTSPDSTSPEEPLAEKMHSGSGVLQSALLRRSITLPEIAPKVETIPIDLAEGSVPLIPAESTLISTSSAEETSVDDRINLEKGHIKDAARVIRRERLTIENIQLDYFNIDADFINIERYDLGKGNLHFVEHQLYKEVLAELATRDSAEIYLGNEPGKPYPYPRNAVVVDMLVRDAEAVIHEDRLNLGHPATHSFVLWKRSDKDIILIDPSNTAFSKPIVEALNKLIGRYLEITSEVIEKGKLYNPGPRITGYSDYTDPYPKPRDCTDMAIKVVLELNEQQKKEVSKGESSGKEAVEGRRKGKEKAEETADPKTTVLNQALSQLSNQSAVNPELRQAKLSGTSERQLTSSKASVRKRSREVLTNTLSTIKVVRDSPEYMKNAILQLQQEYENAKKAIEIEYIEKLAHTTSESEKAKIIEEQRNHIESLDKKYGGGNQVKLKAMVQSNPPFSLTLTPTPEEGSSEMV